MSNVTNIFDQAIREARSSIVNDTLEDALQRHGPEAVDRALPKAVRELHAANSEFDHSIATPSLSEFPREVLEEFYNNIGSMANRIDARAVRPDNTHIQRQLREAEARKREQSGAASISIYKTHTPNPDYATTAPLPWSNQMPKNANFSRTSIEDHAHTREGTIVPDVRCVLRGVLGDEEALPRELVDSEMFRYLVVPGDTVDALQSLAAHDAALDLDTSLTAKLRAAQPAALGAMLATVRAASELPVFAVLLRPSGIVEVCLTLEPTASLFTVASFSLAHAVPGTFSVLCDSICAEITKTREKLTEEAEKDPAQAGSFRSPEEIVGDIKRVLRLQRLFHCDYRSAERGLYDDLCQTSAVVGVFDTEYAKLLLDTQVVFQYMYFSCCQCHHEPTLLHDLLLGTVSEGSDSGVAASTTASRPRKRIRTQEDFRTEESTALFKETEVNASVPNKFITPH